MILITKGNIANYKFLKGIQRSNSQFHKEHIRYLIPDGRVYIYFDYLFFTFTNLHRPIKEYF